LKLSKIINTVEQKQDYCNNIKLKIDKTIKKLNGFIKDVNRDVNRDDVEFNKYKFNINEWIILVNSISNNYKSNLHTLNSENYVKNKKYYIKYNIR
jgi:hypothetical protein